VRDSINLTAAVINPSGTVKGTVNATGCNIGVYYGHGKKGSVSSADIFGANYFGIVNDGGKVDIKNSKIHEIGETPFNGAQHGVAIYFTFNSGASGTISGNIVSGYQKAGIVVNGVPDSAEITKNNVHGLGPVNIIAQNGIEVGYGAKATVSGNTVTGNSYTGGGLTASGGIIAFGGDCYGGPVTTKTNIKSNIGAGNDVAIWLSNLDASCNAVTTPTNITVTANFVRDDAVTNTSGAGAGAGYQAGISDQGDKDQIVKNDICGVGYTPVTPPPYLFSIDVTATNSPTVTGNTFCGTGPAPVSTKGAAPLFNSHKALSPFK
jgi:hypothetical protein